MVAERSRRKAMSEITPLPGSVLLAEKIERRQFLRRLSGSLFYGFLAASTGTSSIFGFLAAPAAADGACCPACCGPSPCCNTSCCSKPCCELGTKDCLLNHDTCLGFSKTWGGTSCWTCVDNVQCRTTTCCDCTTNSQAGCPHPNGVNRCVCFQQRPLCGPAQMTGFVIRVDSGALSG